MKTEYLVYLYRNNDLIEILPTYSLKTAWLCAYSTMRDNYGECSFDLVNGDTGEVLLSGYFLTQHIPYGVTHIALCLHEFSRQREFVVGAKTWATLGY